MIHPTNYRKISRDTFATAIVEGRQPAILVFGADWSGNSEIMNSMMERLSREFKKEVNFYKVDLEEQKEISRFFGVHTIPTTVMLNEGEVVEFLKGFIPASKMRKKIASIYSKDND